MTVFASNRALSGFRFKEGQIFAENTACGLSSWGPLFELPSGQCNAIVGISHHFSVNLCWICFTLRITLVAPIEKFLQWNCVAKLSTPSRAIFHLWNLPTGTMAWHYPGLCSRYLFWCPHLKSLKLALALHLSSMIKNIADFSLEWLKARNRHHKKLIDEIWIVNINQL